MMRLGISSLLQKEITITIEEHYTMDKFWKGGEKMGK
jgi:hypothetical protein